jgi:hypothetical protein
MLLLEALPGSISKYCSVVMLISPEAVAISLAGLISPSERRVIFGVKEDADGFDDLLQAAQSSLDFWDNPLHFAHTF